MELDLDLNLKMKIYNFIPVASKKYCNRESYKIYLSHFLPSKYDDWNIDKIKETLLTGGYYNDFFNLKINNMVIHNIYLNIKREKLEKFFDDYYSKDSKKIFYIIVKHCDDPDNFFMPLPHHYLIFECFRDIFTHKKYHKWLKSPEEKKDSMDLSIIFDN